MRKQIIFRGEQLSYSDRGKGRAVVLLHGFLACSELWDKFNKRLARSYRLIEIDLPAHGESAALGYAHPMELLAEAVKAVIDELQIRKIVLVGHSLGGYVSMAFAESYPDNLLGLVLINSSAKGDSPERKASRDQLIGLLKKNKDQALQKLVPAFFQIKQRTTHWNVKKYLLWARTCSLQGIIATLEGMKIRKEREIVLKFAPYPYLYLIGKHDPLFVVESLLEEASIGENGQAIVLEKASHMAPLESSEEVLRHLKIFIKSV